MAENVWDREFSNYFFKVCPIFNFKWRNKEALKKYSNSIYKWRIGRS